jgi:hypothetical protein
VTGDGWASLQALVKKFTRHTVKDVRGPITVVMNKKRRLTLIECPNDINSMIVRRLRLAMSHMFARVPLRTATTTLGTCAREFTAVAVLAVGRILPRSRTWCC